MPYPTPDSKPASKKILIKLLNRHGPDVLAIKLKVSKVTVHNWMKSWKIKSTMTWS